MSIRIVEGGLQEQGEGERFQGDLAGMAQKGHMEAMKVMSA